MAPNFGQLAQSAHADKQTFPPNSSDQRRSLGRSTTTYASRVNQYLKSMNQE